MLKYEILFFYKVDAGALGECYYGNDVQFNTDENNADHGKFVSYAKRPQYRLHGCYDDSAGLIVGTAETGSYDVQTCAHACRGSTYWLLQSPSACHCNPVVNLEQIDEVTGCNYIGPSYGSGKVVLYENIANTLWEGLTMDVNLETASENFFTDCIDDKKFVDSSKLLGGSPITAATMFEKIYRSYYRILNSNSSI